MTEEQNERLVLAFERIASSLEGMHEEAKQAGSRYWPNPKQQREAIVSRVEPDDERARRMQGARRRTIEEVINPDAEENEEEYTEIIGERTRMWLRDHPESAWKHNAGTKTPVAEKKDGDGPQAT